MNLQGELVKLKVVEFLNSIGIEAKPLHGASGFVPGVLIENGKILYDPTVATVADLLHEAGHLAITPPEYRGLMSKGLIQGLKCMFDSIESESIELDSPLFKAIIQCSDAEATAWAFAAGVHLQLPKESIIDAEDYDGTGNDVLFALEHCTYLGINGLHHSGMSIKGKLYASKRNLEPYPAMQRWVQPAGLSKSCDRW